MTDDCGSPPAGEGLPGERSPASDIFLSVCKEDSAWARWFAKELRYRGKSVFLYTDSLPLGQNWRSALTDAVRSSRFVILILSPEALESPECRLEWEESIADDADGRRSDRVIPVVMRAVLEDRLPTYIRARQMVRLDKPETARSAFESLLLKVGVPAHALFSLDPEAEGAADSEAAETPSADTRWRPALAPRRFVGAVAILGAGYVGLSLTSAVAAAGYDVVVTERNPAKRAALKLGQAHLAEPGVSELFESVTTDTRIEIADGDLAARLRRVRLAVVCLGPMLRDAGRAQDGHQSPALSDPPWVTEKFTRILEELGHAILHGTQSGPINVIITGTLRPSDFRLALETLEKHSRSKMGTRFTLAIAPLFVREGSILADLRSPPFILTGTADGIPNSASVGWVEVARRLLAPEATTAEVVCMRAESAAVVKLASNAFHALKVGFANEVGRICRQLTIDSREVMDVFVRDRSLNISSRYLQPGFAFGGWCLEKDVIGLLETGGSRAGLPLLASITQANRYHLDCAVQLIREELAALGERSLGVFGLTFKAGSDDLRASPSLEVLRRLPSELEYLVHDPDLDGPLLFTGVNAEVWKNAVDELRLVVQEPATIVRKCRVLVIAKAGAIPTGELNALLGTGHVLIDLVGELANMTDLRCRVRGLV